MTHNQDLGGRTAYYNNCAVAPDDADEAYFLTAPFVRSIDGGRTAQQQTGRRRRAATTMTSGIETRPTATG